MMSTRKPFGERIMRVTGYLRHVVGPADVGPKDRTDMVRSDEERQHDLDSLHLRRVVNPDGTSYLVKDTDPSA